jgi:cysteine desulfurase/selenocysteine lyase
MNIKEKRNDFPILQQQVYGKPLVYLDSGVTTQKPQAVIDAISHHYCFDNSNVHRGLHALSMRSTAAYEKVRETAKHFINARHTQEIIFVRGTTEAINLVAQSYARSRLKPNHEILVSEMEHHSNIVPWQIICEQTGAKLRVIPITDKGEIDLKIFTQLLNKNTQLVALTHVSNVLGTINPLQEIIALAHAQNIPVLVDGAQAAPHLAIDVQALDCDFYAFSSHKMYGPTGLGVLYGKTELLESMPPYQGGGDMISSVSFEKTQYNKLPYKFEAGTPNIAGAIGFGTAMEYLQNIGLRHIAAYEHELLEYASSVLSEIPGLKILGQATNKASLISFVLDGIHAHDVGTILDREGIAVRAGHHCAMPLMQRYKVAATVRASLGLYNNKQDIDALVAGIKEVQRLFNV